ncbi:MFS transporter [Granulicella mallensis]|jgi:predicted MFS family arabinose efflux permease|uniref:Putative MFS family arabinose efflux permease n=1 Tax=Granulicella mallensis TaxID=940614 RepID=A0A7W7ZW68_9BACT|nr:MFS transporter [Granulicella mallensis]MBB5066401.1 putative MFS family arabinose efflux permease [Granulicella mallensis]
MEKQSQIGMGGRWALPFLGVACAVGVGSIYYNQPLLLVMGQSLHQTAKEMGFVAVATQVGYACGIMSFVPLGDITDRRKLMVRMYAGVSVALLIAALSHHLATMLIASVLIGLMASVTHIVLPMAPELVPHERRGQAIGTVMTGLLLGVLLARSFAGWVSGIGGWRSVFFAAALMNAIFVPVLYKVMPRSQPHQDLTYKQTLRSLWTLFRDEPLLREAGTIGGLTFATFSCFWTTLAFVLSKHYGMGPGVAGTFGVVGAAGAMVAPFAGRLSDRHGTRFVVTLAGGIMTFCYLWIWLCEGFHVSTTLHMVFLVFGVLALDLGMQMMQVGNQTRIFGLGELARSRLNTIYMTMYFIGGAIGSALASLAWSRWEWNGVCALEIGLIVLAGVRHATGYSRRHPQSGPSIPPSEMEIA